MPSNDALQRSLSEINQQYTRLLDALSALRALSDIDTGPADEALLLQHAVQILLEYQAIQFAAIFLSDGEALYYKAGQGLSHGQQPQALMSRLAEVFCTTVRDPSTHLMCGMTKATLTSSAGFDLHALFGPDVTADPSLLPGILHPSSRGRTLCVPIKDGADVLGMLVAYYPEMESRLDSHQHMLVLYSNFLGQIIANRRRTHSMEELIQQRTRELEQALHDSHQLRLQFEELSIKDVLTGLHNRRFFFPAAKTALANCTRQKTPFSAMIIDLDHFKQINDNFGHAFGDDTLVQSTRLIVDQTRDADIIARIGGEEFAIAMPDCNRRGAIQLAERILATLRQHDVVSDKQQIQVTASIGIACVDTSPEAPAVTLDDLLQQADQALYDSKANGRDQYQLYQA